MRGIGDTFRALYRPQALPAGESSRAKEFAFDPRWHRAAIVFLVVTTALRLLQLPTLELAPDEAYYWDWSRRLALGYYDQGPMIAYVIRATTLLFGTNEFGVRFGVLAASLVTLFCCYTLARRLFSPLTGFLTVLLLGLTPLMEVGSLIATYDPLLVCFYALTALLLERALFAPDARAQRSAWLGAGVTTGLGFLSKHTMLLILPCLLLFLVLSPAHRHWLRRPEPYLAFLLALLLYSGVFWWNAHHHWWTFGHLLFLTAKVFGSPLRRFGDFLGSQALLLGPVLFAGSLAASVRAFLPHPPLPSPEPVQAEGEALTPRPSLPMLGERGEKPSPPGPLSRTSSGRPSPTPNPLPLPAGEREGAIGVGEGNLFLACLGLPIFLLFCLMTLKAKVQGNWAPCAWLTPTILLAAWITEWAGRSDRAFRAARRLVLVTAAVSGFLTLTLVSPTLRFHLGVRLPPDADLSNTAYGWRQVAARVQQIRAEMEQGGRRKVFITGNGYQYCALMAFYLPDHPETFDLFLHFRLTMYAAHVERLQEHLGEDAIFINENEVDEKDLRTLFERVAWEPPFPIWRRPYFAAPIRTIHIARCARYRLYMGLKWAEGG